MARTAIVAELETIRRNAGGVLRPEDVVSFAADPDTELHSRFEWDDTEAAQQYRLWQARQLIRVTVTVLPPIPQLSVSTSSMMTIVVSGFLLSSTRKSSVTPAIRAAFFSGVSPSGVTLMFTKGMIAPTFVIML
jgi:hypothetical protein